MSQSAAPLGLSSVKSRLETPVSYFPLDDRAFSPMLFCAPRGLRIDAPPIQAHPGRMTAPILTQDTLVLNRSWMAIATTPVRHALSLIFTGSAQAIQPETFEVHDFGSWVALPIQDGAPSVSTVTMNLRVPEVIVLLRYSGIPKQHLPFTRRNLLRRDRAMCQYCSRYPGHAELSIDHVIPRARGGETSWENCVLACVQCNRRKGSKMPEQVGMKLNERPRAPQWSPIFEVAGTHKREAWRRFVAEKHWGQQNGKSAS